MYHNQRSGFKNFWHPTIRETVKRKHELVGQADIVQPHPAGDSSGTPKYAQPSKPLTLWDSLPFFSPAVQFHTLPVSKHSLCREEGTAQSSVVSPAAHVIKGVEKY